MGHLVIMASSLNHIERHQKEIKLSGEPQVRVTNSGIEYIIVESK